MQETLFPIEDFTDTGIAAEVLKELTCRQCGNSFRCSTLAEPGWFCKERKSEKTQNGHLRVKTKIPNDNAISAYIADFKDVLAELQVVASDEQPWKGEEPSYNYKAAQHASRVIGLLIRDLKEIRADVNRARKNV